MKLKGLKSLLHNFRFNTTFKWHQRATNLRWYKKWHDFRFAHHFHVLIVIMSLSLILIGALFPNQSYASLTEQSRSKTSSADFNQGTLSNTDSNGNDVELASNSLSNSGGGSWNYRRQLGVDYSAGSQALSDYQIEVDSEKSTVLNYNFDEASGTTVNDSSNNGLNATATGTGVATGRFGNSRVINSPNGYVSVADNAAYDLTDNITMEMWLYPTTYLTGYANQIVSKWSATTDATYALYFFGDTAGYDYKKITMYANAGGTWKNVSAKYELALNTWQHVVWTYNSTTGGQLYVNGLPIGAPTGSGVLYNNAQPLQIGYQANSNGYFPGRIDDFKLHNKKFSDTEVAASYTSPTSEIYQTAQTDGDDFRFLNSDGRTELSYFLDTYNVATNGKKNYRFYVKIPTINANSNFNIYMYYGNSLATKSSSGSNTFANFAENVTSGNFPSYTNSTGYIIEANVTATSLTTEGPEIVFDITNNGLQRTNIDYNKNGNIFRRFDYDVSANVLNMQTIATTHPLNSASKYRIVVKDSSYWFYFNGSLKLSGSNLPYTQGLIMYLGWGTGDSGTYNSIFVRKYATVVPNVSVGAELALMPYKKDINFNTTATGANIATDQVGFPVAIHVNSSSMPDANERSRFFGAWNTNGKRVQFWESDQSFSLEYEVESYSSGSQEAIYWVRVPKVNGNSTTDKIILAYGRSTGVDQDNQNGVWTNGYAAVYHLNEDKTEGAFDDSTAYSRNLSNLGSTTFTGRVGKGRDFNGSSARIYQGTAADWKWMHGAVNPTAFQYTVDALTSFDNPEADTFQTVWDTNYACASAGSGSGLYFDDRSLYSRNRMIISCITKGVSGVVVVNGNQNDTYPSSTAWQSLTVSHNQALANLNQKIYLNGNQSFTLDKTAEAPSTLDAYEAFTIGGSLGGGYFDGKMDEVRVSSVERSADWVKLSHYSTLKTSFNGDSWLTFSAESQGNDTPLGYKTSGYYLSPEDANVFDLGWIGDNSWLTATPNFQANVVIPANTSIVFKARAGRAENNSIVWDNTAGAGGWVTLGTAIVSGVFNDGGNWDTLPDNLGGYNWRYVQIRADFTSDGAATPTLSDYTLTFGTDLTSPTNPNFATTYTENGGAEIANSVWTNETTPYIEWTGAEDEVGGSGISCYYVYLGTDNTADPETAGLSKNAGDNCFSTPSVDLATVDYNPLEYATSGEVYYLRVDTADKAGNVTDMPNGTSIFTYQFDNIAPTPPSAANKNPIGYSAVNLFSFDWTGYESTDDYAGVVKYQYKTGNPGATWVDIAGTSFSNLALLPIANGQNIIYIRGVDAAGNVSESPQDWYRDYFYYSASAPSEPQNLVVDPNSSSTNSFNFTWNKSASFTADGIKGYRYSVNALPTAENSVYIVDPQPNVNPGQSISTGSIPAATQQGVNTFYVVAIDTNDAVNYSNYASIQFEANTSAPGAPGSATITDSSNREASQWSLTTSWNAALGNVDHYKIYRSEDGENFNSIATTTATGYFDSNLTQGQTYFYKVTAVDSANAESAPSTIVSDQPTGKYTTPPSVVSGPYVTTTAVGAVVTWSTDRPSSSFVEYSTDTSYNLSNGSLTPTTDHSVTVSGLNPSTTYNFRVQSLDEERDYDPTIAYSQNYTLATSAAPGISEVKVSDISLYSAIVTWKTTSSATSKIKYGLTTGYGQEVVDESGSSVTTHTVRLSNLRHSTNYNFKITGVDIDNNYMESDNYIFTTLIFPTVSNVRFEQVKNSATSTLKVTWESNVPLTSVVKYRIADGGAVREFSSSKLTDKHEALISNLRDNTTYLLNVEGRDAHGNLATSDQNRVKTDFDTRPPAISNITTETSLAGFGSDSKGQAIVSWETDELSTSQIEYGLGVSGTDYSYKTQEDSSLTTSHVVIITGLKPSSSYHFRVVSKDSSNNMAVSEDNSILTEQASSSVLDVIINSLQSTLGWLFGAFGGN